MIAAKETGRMNRWFWIGAAMTLAGCATLLLNSALDWEMSRRLLKMIAATGFLVAALGAGAANCPYGRVLFIGLVLSWFGDLLLTFSGPIWFLAGLIAFLLGHVSYGIGFLSYERCLRRSGVTLAVLLVPAALLLWWMWEGIPVTLKAAVVAYVVIITVMVALAVGTLGAPGGGLAVTGATLFYLSDLFVARGQFVTDDWMNANIGLPLYFAGQLFLAASIAPVSCIDSPAAPAAEA